MDTEKKEPTVVDFGTGTPERWHHPEIAKQLIDEMNSQIKFYNDNNLPNFEKTVRKDYSKKYKASVVQKYLDENPDYSVLTPSDEFDDELKDEIIRRNFKLKPNDQITKSQENWYEGFRLHDGIKDIEEEPLVHRIDKLFNPSVIKEDKEWEEAAKKAVPTPSIGYKPMFQNTSPSRMSMFRNTPQVIDPSLPLYLQTANPYIPWGKDHPLRIMWNKKVDSMRINSDEEEFDRERQLRVMDEINNPHILYERMFDRDSGEPYYHEKDNVNQINSTGWTPSLLHEGRKYMQSIMKDVHNK